MDYNENKVKSFLPKRPEDSNKGTFGHVLNIAGSEFYPGAAYLSSLSALKVGCGLVTLASDAATLQAIANKSPDIILHSARKINIDFSKKFQAVSIGCGLSQSKEAVRVFKRVLKFLKCLKTPVVIDADGLNILSGLKNFSLPQHLILTPHPKEMARLMEVDVQEILNEPSLWVKKCCEKYNCTAVLKLHKTLVSDNKGNFYENGTGNTALSHGGSGDVLCGMISGFLAQGLDCFEASCLAVYLHGLAAEIASKDLSEYSALASDLLEYIPKAIKSI